MWDLPTPGLEPVSPAGRRIINHCATREVPRICSCKTTIQVEIRSLDYSFLPVNAAKQASLNSPPSTAIMSKSESPKELWDSSLEV